MGDTATNCDSKGGAQMPREQQQKGPAIRPAIRMRLIVTTGNNSSSSLPEFGRLVDRIDCVSYERRTGTEGADIGADRLSIGAALIRSPSHWDAGDDVRIGAFNSIITNDDQRRQRQQRQQLRFCANVIVSNQQAGRSRFERRHQRQRTEWTRYRLELDRNEICVSSADDTQQQRCDSSSSSSGGGRYKSPDDDGSKLVVDLQIARRHRPQVNDTCESDLSKNNNNEYVCKLECRSLSLLLGEQARERAQASGKSMSNGLLLLIGPEAEIVDAQVKPAEGPASASNNEHLNGAPEQRRSIIRLGVKRAAQYCAAASSQQRLVIDDGDDNDSEDDNAPADHLRETLSGIVTGDISAAKIRIAALVGAICVAHMDIDAQRRRLKEPPSSGVGLESAGNDRLPHRGRHRNSRRRLISATTTTATTTTGTTTLSSSASSQEDANEEGAAQVTRSPTPSPVTSVRPAPAAQPAPCCCTCRCRAGAGSRISKRRSRRHALRQVSYAQNVQFNRTQSCSCPSLGRTTSASYDSLSSSDSCTTASASETSAESSTSYTTRTTSSPASSSYGSSGAESRSSSRPSTTSSSNLLRSSRRRGRRKVRSSASSSSAESAEPADSSSKSSRSRSGSPWSSSSQLSASSGSSAHGATTTACSCPDDNAERLGAGCDIARRRCNCDSMRRGRHRRGRPMGRRSDSSRNNNYSLVGSKAIMTVEPKVVAAKLADRGGSTASPAPATAAPEEPATCSRARSNKCESGRYRSKPTAAKIPASSSSAKLIAPMQSPVPTKSRATGKGARRAARQTDNKRRQVGDEAIVKCANCQARLLVPMNLISPSTATTLSSAKRQRQSRYYEAHSAPELQPQLLQRIAPESIAVGGECVSREGQRRAPLAPPTAETAQADTGTSKGNSNEPPTNIVPILAYDNVRSRSASASADTQTDADKDASSSAEDDRPVGGSAAMAIMANKATSRAQQQSLLNPMDLMWRSSAEMRTQSFTATSLSLGESNSLLAQLAQTSRSKSLCTDQKPELAGGEDVGGDHASLRKARAGSRKASGSRSLSATKQVARAAARKVERLLSTRRVSQVTRDTLRRLRNMSRSASSVAMDRDQQSSLRSSPGPQVDSSKDKTTLSTPTHVSQQAAHLRRTSTSSLTRRRTAAANSKRLKRMGLNKSTVDINRSAGDGPLVVPHQLDRYISSSSSALAVTASNSLSAADADAASGAGAKRLSVCKSVSAAAAAAAEEEQRLPHYSSGGVYVGPGGVQSWRELSVESAAASGRRSQIRKRSATTSGAGALIGGSAASASIKQLVGEASGAVSRLLTTRGSRGSLALGSAQAQSQAQSQSVQVSAGVESEQERNTINAVTIRVEPGGETGLSSTRFDRSKLATGPDCSPSLATEDSNNNDAGSCRADNVSSDCAQVDLPLAFSIRQIGARHDDNGERRFEQDGADERSVTASLPLSQVANQQQQQCQRQRHYLQRQSQYQGEAAANIEAEQGEGRDLFSKSERQQQHQRAHLRQITYLSKQQAAANQSATASTSVSSASLVTTSSSAPATTLSSSVSDPRCANEEFGPQERLQPQRGALSASRSNTNNRIAGDVISGSPVHSSHFREEQSTRRRRRLLQQELGGAQLAAAEQSSSSRSNSLSGSRRSSHNVRSRSGQSLTVAESVSKSSMELRGGPGSAGSAGRKEGAPGDEGARTGQRVDAVRGSTEYLATILNVRLYSTSTQELSSSSSQQAAGGSIGAESKEQLAPTSGGLSRRDFDQWFKRSAKRRRSKQEQQLLEQSKGARDSEKRHSDDLSARAAAAGATGGGGFANLVGNAADRSAKRNSLEGAAPDRYSTAVGRTQPLDINKLAPKSNEPYGANLQNTCVHCQLIAELAQSPASAYLSQLVVPQIAATATATTTTWPTTITTTTEPETVLSADFEAVDSLETRTEAVLRRGSVASENDVTAARSCRQVEDEEQSFQRRKFSAEEQKSSGRMFAAESISSTTTKTKTKTLVSCDDDNDERAVNNSGNIVKPSLVLTAASNQSTIDHEDVRESSHSDGSAGGGGNYHDEAIAARGAESNAGAERQQRVGSPLRSLPSDSSRSSSASSPAPSNAAERQQDLEATATDAAAVAVRAGSRATSDQVGPDALRARLQLSLSASLNSSAPTTAPTSTSKTEVSIVVVDSNNESTTLLVDADPAKGHKGRAKNARGTRRRNRSGKLGGKRSGKQQRDDNKFRASGESDRHSCSKKRERCRRRRGNCIVSSGQAKEVSVTPGDTSVKKTSVKNDDEALAVKTSGGRDKRLVGYKLAADDYQDDDDERKRSFGSSSGSSSESESSLEDFSRASPSGESSASSASSAPTSASPSASTGTASTSGSKSVSVSASDAATDTASTASVYTDGDTGHQFDDQDDDDDDDDGGGGDGDDDEDEDAATMASISSTMTSSAEDDAGDYGVGAKRTAGANHQSAGAASSSGRSVAAAASASAGPADIGATDAHRPGNGAPDRLRCGAQAVPAGVDARAAAEADQDPATADMCAANETPAGSGVISDADRCASGAQLKATAKKSPPDMHTHRGAAARGRKHGGDQRQLYDRTKRRRHRQRRTKRDRMRTSAPFVHADQTATTRNRTNNDNDGCRAPLSPSLSQQRSDPDGSKPLVLEPDASDNVAAEDMSAKSVTCTNLSATAAANQHEQISGSLKLTTAPDMTAAGSQAAAFLSASSETVASGCVAGDADREPAMSNSCTMLEVPGANKQARSASLDTAYLLKVPGSAPGVGSSAGSSELVGSSTTGIDQLSAAADDELHAAAKSRSRSVDISLPIKPGEAYGISGGVGAVPGADASGSQLSIGSSCVQTAISATSDVPQQIRDAIDQLGSGRKKFIQGEIKVSYAGGETRALKLFVNWDENCVNGEHLWIYLGSSSEACYVGETECLKHGPRLCCSACKITAHTGCMGILIDKIKFICKHTFKDLSKANSLQQKEQDSVVYHHWVHKRTHCGRCKQCGKTIGNSKLPFSSKEIQAITCSWCKVSYHNKENCYTLSTLTEPCTLGTHRESIIPPNWILKLPATAASIKQTSALIGDADSDQAAGRNTNRQSENLIDLASNSSTLTSPLGKLPLRTTGNNSNNNGDTKDSEAYSTGRQSFNSAIKMNNQMKYSATITTDTSGFLSNESNSNYQLKSSQDYNRVDSNKQQQDNTSYSSTNNSECKEVEDVVSLHAADLSIINQAQGKPPKDRQNSILESMNQLQKQTCRPNQLDYFPSQDINAKRLTPSNIEMTETVSMDTTQTTPQQRQLMNDRQAKENIHHGFRIVPQTIPGVPNAGSKPVLVFVNPRSGGNQGAKMMQKFNWLLNPRQVFDLIQSNGPRAALELYRDVPNLRILTIGGDGTASWILSTLDEVGLSNKIPVAVLPLGTGNDLAQALGWGSGYTDEPIAKILTQVRDSEITYLDRWNLNVERNHEVTPSSPNELSTSSGANIDFGSPSITSSPPHYCAQSSGIVSNTVSTPTMIDQTSCDTSMIQSTNSPISGVTATIEEAGCEQLPMDVINNYFSFGVDAHIALEFHTAREAHPERFNSRLRNKRFYVQAGGKDLLKRKWKDLSNFVTLYCDGQDMTSRLKELKVHSVLFLNIPRYGGGTRPWPTTATSFAKPRTDDGLIEVIGLTTYQLPLLQAGGHGTCIAQCRNAKIITSRTIPMQVDGEPCKLLPSIINISFKNRVCMLSKSKSSGKNVNMTNSNHLRKFD